MRFTTLALLSCGAVLACADGTAPAAPVLPAAPTSATVERTHELFPFAQTVDNTCAGELVQISGTLQVLDQVVTMENGEIRTVFHSNFQNAQGVGLTSGMKYRASIVDNGTWQGLPPGPPGGPWRTSHTGTLHLVIPGGGSSFTWHFVFIVTKEPGFPPRFIVARNDVSCH